MKKIVISAFALVILGNLTGCIAPQGQLLYPKSIDVLSYQVGKEETKNIGAPMIVRANGYALDKYVATQNAQAWSGVIMAGSVWEATYTFEGQTVVTSTSFFNRQLGVIVDEDGDPVSERPLIASSVLNSGLNRPLAGTYRFGCQGCQKGMFKKDANGSLQEGARKEELVYSGKSGDVITINYREYVGNFARPAFYQEVKYDLSSSQTITFRDFKIKVIKADNNSITFIVL